MAEGKLQGEMSNPAVEISNNARLESDPHSHTSTTPGSLSSPRKFCCHSFCASLPDKDNACLVDDNPHFIRFPQPCLDYRLAKLGSKFRKCHKVFECYNCDLAARWIHNCGGTFLNTIDDISSNTFICSKHFKSVEDAQLFKEDPSPATSELQQSFEPICIKLSTLNCAQTLPKTNGECSSGPRVWPTMSNQHCQPTSDVSTTTDNNNRSTNSGMNKNSRFNYWKEYYKSPDTGETNMCNVEATILKKIEDLTRLTTGACPNLPLCLPTLEPLKTSAQINSTRVCCFDQCNSRSDQLVATSAEKSLCFIKFPQPCYYYRRTVTNYGSLLKSHVRCDQCDLAARWLIMCGRKRGLVKLGDIKSTTYICSKHFNSVENAQLYKEDPKSEMVQNLERKRCH